MHSKSDLPSKTRMVYPELALFPISRPRKKEESLELTL